MSIRKVGNRNLVAFGAAEAKNEFGKVLETAMRSGAVAITKHDRVKAVLLSVEEYEALQPAGELERLTAEFDALLDGMQSPRAREAVSAALAMTPSELAAAALARG